MSAHCAIRSCDSNPFRATLCEEHYSAVAREATDVSPEPETNTTHSPPLLRSAFYIFNRMTSNVIDGYRSAFCMKQEDLLRMHVDAAETHIRQGEADRASQSLLQAEQITPSTDIRLGLADLHLREGRYSEALGGYQALRESDPLLAGIPAKLGEALSGLGRYEEAIEQFTLATQQEPKLAGHHYKLGTAFEALGDYNKAASAFSRAAKLDANEPRYHQALGFAYEALGKHDKALGCFKKAIELEPDGKS